MSGLVIETEILDLEPRADPTPAKRADPETLPFLLEVGCEEIPARFLRDAEKGLGERVRAALEQSRLLPAIRAGAVTESSLPHQVIEFPKPPTAELSTSEVAEMPLQTYSTPRRLVVHVAALLAQQPDKVEEIIGPPLKVAVDAKGNYTRAAESFARKNSATLEELGRATTPKGEYLSLQKVTRGRPAGEILSEILAPAILGVSFPKSMYWTSKSDSRFVRPIRWIVAVLGEGNQARTVGFELLGVKSGNFTFGHRTKGREPLSVSGFNDYSNKLLQAIVEIGYANRYERIVKQAQAVLGDASGTIVQDEWLADWIANSTEWPRPMLGTFDERFLHLPREILITVMRDHQRYFAVEDGEGNLRPNFVAVLNIDSDEKGLIRQGHQRVLTARFRDAEFFWNADQKVPLRDRVSLLDRVTYQAKLGSYGDKLRRMLRIAEEICAILDTQNAAAKQPAGAAHSSGIASPQVRSQVLRAVELCKCDLTTQMVQEFTELQGVVGGLYAKAQGEEAEVATAIYDHYLPLGAEGASPRSLIGAVVSLVDKVDSVVAGCAVGNEPTGSSDPFALRRQANGVVKVIIEFNLLLSLKQLIKAACKALESQEKISGDGAHSVSSRVMEFFAERLRYYFESVRRFRYDTVRAVLAAGADEPSDALARAEAMEALRGGDDFEALSAAAKRIRNILAKSATTADWQPGDVAPALLTEDQEKVLHEAYDQASAAAQSHAAAGNYRGALEVISTLRPAVDRFFDKVLVMAEDRAVRQNRLRLLKKLDDLFSGIAHFAEIEGQ